MLSFLGFLPGILFPLSKWVSLLWKEEDSFILLDNFDDSEFELFDSIKGSFGMLRISFEGICSGFIKYIFLELESESKSMWAKFELIGDKLKKV